MDIALQLKDMLITFLDIRVGIIVLAATQLAKFYLPDNIEGKWLPGIAALVGVIAALFVHVDVLKGFITAGIVTGTFGSIKDIVANAGAAVAPKA